MDYHQLFRTYAIHKTWPSLTVDDAIMFLASEAGKVCDARLRTNKNYLRNNERDTDIGEELADVVFMAFRVADTLSINLDYIIKEKFGAKS